MKKSLKKFKRNPTTMFLEKIRERKLGKILYIIPDFLTIILENFLGGIPERKSVQKYFAPG